MSITKNVFTLKRAYELIVDGQWIQYLSVTDPGEPGTLWSWGYNSNGELGDPTFQVGLGCAKSSPIQVPGNVWNEMSMKRANAVARKTDSTLWTWGSSTGNFNAIGRCSPTQLPGNNWCRVGAGFLRAFATKSDGSLWAWGANNSGQLGDDSTITRSSPVQIPGNNWVGAIGSSVAYVGFGTKTDSTLWAWGCAGYGRLGLGDTIPRSSPTQIPGNWSFITTSVGYTTLALKNNGTLWGWGRSTSGQLGVGTPNCDWSSPVQILGTQWVNATSFDGGGLGIKSDGSLWSFGTNGCGMLGLNNTISCNVPQQVPGIWNDISGGRFHILARKSNGTLWTWGGNQCGVLGLGDTICRSSPTQLPGTTWIAINAAREQSFARKS